MSEDMLTQIQRDLLDIKRRLSRLESADKSAVTEWTAFTPTYIGTTVAGTFTYSSRIGYYAVVDNIVHIAIYIAISAVTVAATGNGRITGLPFVVGTNQRSDTVARAFVTLGAGYSFLGGVASAGNDFVSLIRSGDGLQTNFPAGNVVAGSQIGLNFFYGID